jgi:hypothetical protein
LFTLEGEHVMYPHVRVGVAPVVEQDDLFAALTTAPLIDLMHHITCAVCDLSSNIFIGAPGDVCNSCRLDPILTRQHIEHVVGAARNRLQFIITDWETALAAASEADQGRWQKVVALRVQAHGDAAAEAVFVARWTKTMQLGDGLSRILKAHETMEVGCDEVSRCELWAEKALREIAFAS